MIDRQGVIALARMLTPSVVVLALFAVVLYRDEIDWGDAPSWVGAVVTGLAFMIAAQAYRKDRARLALEEERHRLAEERLASAQASQFATWTDGHTFFVRNTSAQPIWEVEAFTDRFNPDPDAEAGDTLPHQVDRWQVVAPGDERRASVPEGPNPSYTGFMVRFTDNAGVGWERESGTLYRIVNGTRQVAGSS